MPKTSTGLREAQRLRRTVGDIVRVQARVPVTELALVESKLLRPASLTRRQWVESLLVGLWCSGPAPAVKEPPAHRMAPISLEDMFKMEPAPSTEPVYVSSLALRERGLELGRAMELARYIETRGIIPSPVGNIARKSPVECQYLDIHWPAGLYSYFARSLEKSGLRTPARFLSVVWAWSQAPDRKLPITLSAQLAATCEFWSHVVNGHPWQPNLRPWDVIARSKTGYTCTPHELIPECIAFEERGLPFTVQTPII